MAANLQISRPPADEYAPFYQRYTSLVDSSDILATLDHQGKQTVDLLSSYSEADGDFRYAPDKWTLKQVVGHLSDCERIFAYRALRISRADSTPMEGFEQDDYAANGPFASSKLSDLVEEFGHVRRATLSLFRNLDPEAWMRRGTANKNAVTVRAIAYITAGHELHHRRILQERYIASLSA